MADAAVAETAPPPDETVASRILRYVSKTPVYFVIVLLGLLWLVPTLGLMLTSLLAPEDLLTEGWWQIFSAPSQATFDNYEAIFENDTITSSLWTTAQIAVLGTVIPIFVGALAGYAFAWLEFPGRDWLFILVIALLVVPLQMALIPIFSLYDTAGLFDSVIGLALFHTAFGLPFAIFLLRNFFAEIPRELLEAARLDGAGEIRLFTRVVMPLGGPAIASLAIFQFLWVWNDMLVALIFADSDSPPITVALQQQVRQFGNNIDVLAPGAFVSMVIPLAVFFAFQRQFVSGVMAGAVK
jgi:alpha-glucoside transport system permease protein